MSIGMVIKQLETKLFCMRLAVNYLALKQ